MWILEILQTVGSINFAPAAIISGGTTLLLAAALIFSEHKKKKVKEDAYDSESDVVAEAT